LRESNDPDVLGSLTRKDRLPRAEVNPDVLSVGAESALAADGVEEGAAPLPGQRQRLGEQSPDTGRTFLIHRGSRHFGPLRWIAAYPTIAKVRALESRRVTAIPWSRAGERIVGEAPIQHQGAEVESIAE
jgi:hypothetical protein